MEGAVLRATVQVILNKVLKAAAEEISLVWGLKEDLKSLSGSVAMIQAVLDDAGRRQVNDKAVELWLINLKDVAYEADDVLDEFTCEILRRKVEIRNQINRKVICFFSPSNPILFHLKMAHKIKNINKSLETINKQANEFGLQRGGIGMTHSHVSLNRETDSFIHDSEVIGRNNDASNVVEMITSSENQEPISVIPIVGMGGLGKTTLAKLIYNDERIKRQFDVRIWVCVSNNFDVKKLLTDILESQTKRKFEVQTRDAILESLQKELGGKKFILVLDDMWNEDRNAWDDFISCLLRINITKGTNIIVTTRKKNVASIVETLPMYCLEDLSEEDCWSIFKENAFADRGTSMTSELEAIGRKIAKKCSGVPLAAKLTGSMMRSKKEKDEWLSFLNDGAWGLFGGESGIKPILKLSFDHLSPPSLKQCFAYCSILVKDFRIEKEQLIQQWMAHGFLQPNDDNNKTMEEIGNEYFNILLQNSLLQDIERDDMLNITHCKMHDLVHDFAQLISKSECFTLKIDTEIKISHVRHLALWNGDEISTVHKVSAKSLRTLFLNNVVPEDMLLNFKYLRVLNFYGTNIEELPYSISTLIHLRYLDLSRTRIYVLPQSVAKLYNLQTLRVCLKYDIRCVELPKKLKNLVSLRHLYINGDETYQMPLEMGRLICLQTLPFFNVGQDKGCRIEELKYLKNLRGKLKIRNLDEVSGREEAQETDLFRKEKLSELTFQWRISSEGSRNDEDVLEGLQPSQNLKYVKIKNFAGNKFPSWIMKMAVSIDGNRALSPLKNLVKIILKDCKRSEKIPTLGGLPHLRDLKLKGMDKVKCIDESFYSGNCNGLTISHDGHETHKLFPSLRRFELSDMPILKEWMEAAEASAMQIFPCLEVLHIFNCPQLKSAPSHFPCLKELGYVKVDSGLPLENICSNKLTTLTDLHIDMISELTSLPDMLMQNNKDLLNLIIFKCHMLTDFSNVWDWGNFLLQSLAIWYCPNLKSIPSLQGLISLRNFVLMGCDGLTCLPSGLHSCASLETLSIEYCNNLVVSFTDIQALHSLSSLTTVNCCKMTDLPQGLHCLTRLKDLTIGPFSEELNSFPSLEGVLSLPSLRSLTLRGRPHWDSIPEQLRYLTALTTIYIEDFGVEALPDWFQNLSSLEYLSLWHCEKLKYLPSFKAMRCLTKLRVLEIRYCPLLEERCAKRIGPEWPKIAHIQTIQIEGVLVQN